MKKAIIIIFILLLILLIFIISLLVNLYSEENQKEVTVTLITEPKTIEDVIIKYNSKYVKQEDSKIYVEFNKDLYEENGESNEIYFNNIIQDLKPFFENKTFYLIDETKNINITIRYNSQLENYIILINNIEDFFNNTNGKDYIDVENTKIAKNTNIFITDDYLNKLNLNSMYFSAVEEDLGEGKELENGYTSYLNGTIKLRLSPIKTVRNIIFSDNYEGSITTDINSGMSLREIYNINSNNNFGSLEEGYLGYKNGNYYLFFYDDEISVYSYSYRYNKDFEDILGEYLETKDLDTFVTKLINRWRVYDYYEYDAEKGNLYVLYSNRGIEIDIKNNNPKGIKLYSNYYFSDETKEFVKNGLITLDSKNDLIEKVEKERRNSN